jgi:hypothetical protein
MKTQWYYFILLNRQNRIDKTVIKLKTTGEEKTFTVKNYIVLMSAKTLFVIYYS